MAARESIIYRAPAPGPQRGARVAAYRQIYEVVLVRPAPGAPDDVEVEAHRLGPED